MPFACQGTCKKTTQCHLMLPVPINVTCPHCFEFLMPKRDLDLQLKAPRVFIRPLCLQVMNIFILTPAPPALPAPVTSGAGGSPTAPRPCGAAPPHAGPSGPGRRRAPCGPPRSAGSAPSAGPERFASPWLPGGVKGGRVREMEQMKNDK